MNAIQTFLEQRRSDLVFAQQYGSDLMQHRSLARAGDLPSNVLLTALATVALAHLLLACLTRRGRKIVVEAVDTALAVVLIVALLAIVLGLPFGRCLPAAAAARLRQCLTRTQPLASTDAVLALLLLQPWDTCR
jgi:hypothetical protein